MISKKYNIGVVGATGSVGRSLISLLGERNFPVSSLKAYATEKSIGKKISYLNTEISVDLIDNIDFSKIDIAFFCTEASISRKYATKAIEMGSIVIDKSSCYRMQQNIPLIVPEVNFNKYLESKNQFIISNPNCCVIPIACVLDIAQKLSKIKRVIISTYQSVSGSGKHGMDSLYQQTMSKFGFNSEGFNIYKKQIAFNIIPEIGEVNSSGDTEEEQKIVEELQKIFSNDIKISATCVRVPVYIGHSFSINIEFEGAPQLSDLKREFTSQKHIKFLDFGEEDITPKDFSGKDYISVSRLRKDTSCSNSYNLWVGCDNLRKGASLNAIQIAEQIIKTK